MQIILVGYNKELINRINKFLESDDNINHYTCAAPGGGCGGSVYNDKIAKLILHDEKKATVILDVEDTICLDDVEMKAWNDSVPLPDTFLPKLFGSLP